MRFILIVLSAACGPDVSIIHGLRKRYHIEVLATKVVYPCIKRSTGITNHHTNDDELIQMVGSATIIVYSCCVHMMLAYTTAAVDH